MSSIIQPTEVGHFSTLLSSVSEEDMASARAIAGNDTIIHAFLKPPAAAKTFRHVFCTQKSLERTAYVITEGRFYQHVPDYEHPYCGPIMKQCGLPKNAKSFYFDIDDITVRDAFDPNAACQCLKGLINPENVQMLFLVHTTKATHKGRTRKVQHFYEFYVSSEKEKQLVIQLVRDIKRRHDEATPITAKEMASAVQSAVQSVVHAPSSKRVFVASSSDPSNFTLFMIESDSWDSFLEKMKEKFGMPAVASVKLADVGVAVSSVSEVSSNDKLVIY